MAIAFSTCNRFSIAKLVNTHAHRHTPRKRFVALGNLKVMEHWMLLLLLLQQHQQLLFRTQPAPQNEMGKSNFKVNQRTNWMDRKVFALFIFVSSHNTKPNMDWVYLDLVACIRLIKWAQPRKKNAKSKRTMERKTKRAKKQRNAHPFWKLNDCLCSSARCGTSSLEIGLNLFVFVRTTFISYALRAIVVKLWILILLSNLENELFVSPSVVPKAYFWAQN